MVAFHSFGKVPDSIQEEKLNITVCILLCHKFVTSECWFGHVPHGLLGSNFLITLKILSWVKLKTFKDHEVIFLELFLQFFFLLFLCFYLNTNDTMIQWCKQLNLMEKIFEEVCVALIFSWCFCLNFSYKHTTCIWHWSDVETTIST